MRSKADTYGAINMPRYRALRCRADRYNEEHIITYLRLLVLVSRRSSLRLTSMRKQRWATGTIFEEAAEHWWWEERQHSLRLIKGGPSSTALASRDYDESETFR